MLVLPMTNDFGSIDSNWSHRRGAVFLVTRRDDDSRPDGFQ